MHDRVVDPSADPTPSPSPRVPPARYVHPLNPVRNMVYHDMHAFADALVEVPPGPAEIEALWGPLDAALAHDAPIAPIPRESASLPAPLVRALRSSGEAALLA